MTTIPATELRRIVSRLERVERESIRLAPHFRRELSETIESLRHRTPVHPNDTRPIRITP